MVINGDSCTPVSVELARVTSCVLGQGCLGSGLSWNWGLHSTHQCRNLGILQFYGTPGGQRGQKEPSQLTASFLRQGITNPDSWAGPWAQTSQICKHPHLQTPRYCKYPNSANTQTLQTPKLCKHPNAANTWLTSELLWPSSCSIPKPSKAKATSTGSSRSRKVLKQLEEKMSLTTVYFQDMWIENSWNIFIWTPCIFPASPLSAFAAPAVDFIITPEPGILSDVTQSH